jgi:hypothetical protein
MADRLISFSRDVAYLSPQSHYSKVVLSINVVHSELSLGYSLLDSLDDDNAHHTPFNIFLSHLG